MPKRWHKRSASAACDGCSVRRIDDETPRRIVGLPHNSPLMKLPMRPAKIPIPGSGARKSSTSATRRPRRRAKIITATMHADQAAVKRHAAFPDLDDRQRIVDDLLDAIEQHPADAAAEDHAERARRRSDHRRRSASTSTRLRGAPAAEPPGGGEADDVHQAVPADRQRAERDDDGIDRGIGKHWRAMVASDELAMWRCV